MDRSRLRAFAFLLAVVAAVCVAVPAGGQQSEGGLRNKIDSQRSQERSLSSAVARLGKLERATAREVGILEKRVAAVQADLVAAETKLASTEQRRNRQRERALRLRARLKKSRAQLATVLRHRYTGGRPDIVTVVLRADGFAQLLESVDFLKRVELQNQRISDTVKDARRDALGQRRLLTRLAEERRVAADAVRKRHDALATIAAGLRERRARLGQARAARRRAAARDAGEPAPRRALAEPPAGSARAGAEGGRPGRAVVDPVAGRAVRVRRSEPAAELGRRVGLLSVHARDLARPGRLDAARLPGAEGRAGPARGAVVGRRQRRGQLGLRRARRDHLNRRRSPGSSDTAHMNFTVRLVGSTLAATLALATGAQAADTGPYVALGDSYTAAPLVPNQVGVPAGCARSDHNYPSVARAALGSTAFRDVSCSSAVTERHARLPGRGRRRERAAVLRADGRHARS